MQIKRDVIEAIVRAVDTSRQLPEEQVCVMVKPRQTAVVCVNKIIWRERVLDGWESIATFKGGQLL